MEGDFLYLIIYSRILILHILSIGFYSYLSIGILLPLNNTPYLIFNGLAIIGDFYRG